MKRIGNLFEKIVDIENLKRAHKNARKGKRFYTEVKMINAEEHLEKYYLNAILRRNPPCKEKSKKAA